MNINNASKWLKYHLIWNIIISRSWIIERNHYLSVYKFLLAFLFVNVLKQWSHFYTVVILIIILLCLIFVICMCSCVHISEQNVLYHQKCTVNVILFCWWFYRDTFGAWCKSVWFFKNKTCVFQNKNHHIFSLVIMIILQCIR